MACSLSQGSGWEGWRTPPYLAWLYHCPREGHRQNQQGAEEPHLPRWDTLEEALTGHSSPFWSRCWGFWDYRGCNLASLCTQCCPSHLAVWVCNLLGSVTSALVLSSGPTELGWVTVCGPFLTGALGSGLGGPISQLQLNLPLASHNTQKPSGVVENEVCASVSVHTSGWSF